MKPLLMAQLVNIRVVPRDGSSTTKPTSAGRAFAGPKVILARILSFFGCCFSLAGPFGAAQRTLIKRSVLFCLVLGASCPKSVLAQNVQLVGSPWVLIQTMKGASAPCGPNKTVFFDGTIAPFSYIGTSGQTVIQVHASLGDQNFRYLGSLTSQGGLAANFQVDCNNGQGMYTSLKSSDPASFRWREWLYGVYRSPTTGHVYATIYNEYYGGNYASGGISENGCRLDHPEQCCYSGVGLAKSTDNGKTFNPIQPAPNHVIARVPYLYYSNAGHGMGSAFEGGALFSNPNDAYLYRALNQFKNTPTGDYGVTMMRTRKVDIDDPTSWKVDFTVLSEGTPFYPSGAYGKTFPLPFGTPFYLGWSAYFNQYIMTGVCGPNYCFVLSADMIHWSPGITIMPIDSQAHEQSGSGLPSLLDPSYLAQTGDGSAANGGIIGQNPYLTFIRQNVSSTIQQQVVVQQLNFQGADTTPPTATVTAPSNGAYVAGTTFPITGTASDDRGVFGMQFKVDGQNFGSEWVLHPGPLTLYWNTVAAGNGSHTLELVARDWSSNTTTSPTVTVTVDNTPPAGAWVTAPFDGQHVRGSGVTIRGAASDNYGVAGVRYTLDGGPLSPEYTTFPYSHLWNTSFTAQGPHTLRAVARDLASNTTTSLPITVIVDNTAPTAVAVTSPSNGAMVSGIVTVYGTASDNIGVSGVQFLLNNAPLGGFTKIAPYSTVWNTTLWPSGSYTLKVEARDSAGNTTTSPAVTVTVNNGS